MPGSFLDKVRELINSEGEPGSTYDESSSIPPAEGPDPRLRLHKRPPKPSSAEGQYQYQPQLKAIPGPAQGQGMAGSTPSEQNQTPYPSQASPPPVAYKQTNPFGGLTTQQIMAIVNALEEKALKQ